MTLNGGSTSVTVVSIISLFLSSVAVALRCFVRLRLVKAFGWDDGLIVFAMVQDMTVYLERWKR